MYFQKICRMVQSSLVAAILLALVPLLAGCTPFLYSWKQEKELLRDMSLNFSKSLQNENDQHLMGFSVGAQADLHEFSPIENSIRGLHTDIDRILKP